jgi:hypothetical protein
MQRRFLHLDSAGGSRAEENRFQKVKNTSEVSLALGPLPRDRREWLSDRLCLGAHFPLKLGNHEPADARNFAANFSTGGNDAAGISVRSIG